MGIGNRKSLLVNTGDIVKWGALEHSGKRPAFRFQSQTQGLTLKFAKYIT